MTELDTDDDMIKYKQLVIAFSNSIKEDNTDNLNKCMTETRKKVVDAFLESTFIDVHKVAAYFKE
tara:strand:+ start:555 stop:749 length:195 start_codon:yes stop_codon:yes gene_type:complete